MPKENIDDVVVPGFRAEVSWSPGKYVQVATTNEHSTLKLPADDVPLSGPPGAQTINQPPGAGDEQLFLGWFATLDRDGCNRMIRALRRARDSAFGKDE